MSSKKKSSSSSHADAAANKAVSVKKEPQTPPSNARAGRQSLSSSSSSAKKKPLKRKMESSSSDVSSSSESSSSESSDVDSSSTETEDEDGDSRMSDASERKESTKKKKAPKRKGRSAKKEGAPKRKKKEDAGVNASTALWTSAELYEQRGDEIMALLEQLSNLMSPKLYEYFKKVKELHQRMKEKVVDIVAYAPRGQGKSTLINNAAVSYTELERLGFEQLWGKYPLQAKGGKGTVTRIPAWLEYTDPAVAPQCLIKLSDNTEVDIFSSAEKASRKSLDASSKFKNAPLFIRQLAIFRYANCNAELLLSSKQPSYVAQKAAGTVSIVHMTLKSNWAFGEKYRVGDTLGWEDKVEERLNKPMLKLADIIMTLTNREMAQTDLRHLLEVDAFDRKNQPKKQAVLLNFYRGSGNDNDDEDEEEEEEKQNAPAAAAASSSSSSNQIAPADIDDVSIDAAYKDMYVSFEELLRDTEVLPGLTWDYRNYLLRSLQQNLVVRGADHIGSVKAEDELRSAFQDSRNKYLRSESIQFMKEASCLVFATKGLTSKLATKLSSTPYLRKVKESQFAAASKEIDAMVKTKAANFVASFFDTGIMKWDEDLYSAICSENKAESATAIARAQASSDPASAASSSFSSYSSSSSGLNERQHDERAQIASLRTSLMDVLRSISDKYYHEHLLVSIQEFVKKVRADELEMSHKMDDAGEVDLNLSINPQLKSPKSLPLKGKSKDRVKMELDQAWNAPVSSSAAAAAPAAAAAASSSSSSSRPIAAAPAEPVSDEYQDLEEFLMYLKDTKEISAEFEMLRGDLEMTLLDMFQNSFGLRELIQRSMKPSDKECETLRTAYEQGARTLSEGDRMQQVKNKCEEIVLAKLCEEMQGSFVSQWKAKMEKVARKAWSKIGDAVKGIESGKNDKNEKKAVAAAAAALSSDKKSVAPPPMLSIFQQCVHLKNKLNTFLTAEKAKEANPALNKGGKYNDKIRTAGLPNASNMHRSLKANIDHTKDYRSKKNQFNEKLDKLRPVEIENATSVDLTKAAALPINFSVSGGSGSAAAAASSSSSSSFSVSSADRRMHVELSAIKAEDDDDADTAVGTVTLSSSLKSSLDSYRETVSDAQFGVVEEFKTRSLAPIYTPLMFTSLEDAQATLMTMLVRKSDKKSVALSDYEGMNHLLFFSVQPGQQQEWLEEALTNMFANELRNVVTVIVPSADVTIHLDVLRSILLHLRFEYAWRRTLNFENIYELEAVKNATFPCQLGFAMASMQSSMRDLFRHTITQCAKTVTDDLGRAFNKSLYRSKRRDFPDDDRDEADELLNELKKLNTGEASKSLDVWNEGKLRKLVRYLRIINEEPDVNGRLEPMLKVVEPYFLCAMMAPFPRGFMIHGALEFYPDFHKVHNASTRVHSLVLEHLPALSQAPFNTMSEIVGAIESNKLYAYERLKRENSSSKKGSKPSILIPSRLAELKAEKFEFLKSTLHAEQHCKDRISANKYCVPHVLCASFGVDLGSYSSKQLETNIQTRSSAASNPATPTAAAAASGSNAAAAASSSTVTPKSKSSSSKSKSSSSKKVKKEEK